MKKILETIVILGIALFMLAGCGKDKKVEQDRVTSEKMRLGLKTVLT